jgi:hypothetical protein
MYDLFQNQDVRCSVTNRTHVKDTSMRAFFQEQYSFLPLPRIADTFGFVEDFTELYGGRRYHPQYVLSARDVAELYDLRIGLKLCLQNHFITQEDCENNRAFLAKYHRPGNVVICISEVLARFVKEEFPDYSVEASIVKEVHDLAAIEECLQLFDLFTVPPSANDDLDFLASLPQKERIILFANARCLYHCELRTCYWNVSVETKRRRLPGFEAFKPSCSPQAPNKFEYTLFDLDRFYGMGFRNFKWIIPQQQLHQQADLKPGRFRL